MGTWQKEQWKSCCVTSGHPVCTSLPGSLKHVTAGTPCLTSTKPRMTLSYRLRWPEASGSGIIKESEFREHCLCLVLTRVQIQDAGSPKASEFPYIDMCSFVPLLPMAQSSTCTHILQSHIHVLTLKYLSRVKDAKRKELDPVSIPKLLTVC